MNESLSQIAYVSRRTPGVSDDEVVDDIALPSYRKNRDLEITGCLWFDQEHFVQVIEGPAAAIETLYETIRMDRRHRDLHKVLGSTIENRNFARFSLKVVKDESMDPVRRLIDLVYGNRSTASGESDLVNEIILATGQALQHLAQAGT